MVRGTNRPFPIDMLRYDCCWPARPEDVALIQCPLSQREKVCYIRLNTLKGPPTADRWASFGWEIEGHVKPEHRTHRDELNLLERDARELGEEEMKRLNVEEDGPSPDML